MKYSLIHILLFLFAGLTSINAETPDSLFWIANEQYTEGNYETAIENYLKIDRLGYASAALYYNTANAYFRSNKIGKARLFYERALLLDPGDEDIRANLNFLKELLTDRFEEVPELFIKRWFTTLINVFNINGWFILSAILFSVGLIALLIYLFSENYNLKRPGFYLGVILILFSFFSLSISKRQQNKIENPGTAIIIDPSGSVKSAPRKSGKDLFILHEGTKVWIENELDNWIEIRISDGRKGWVNEKILEQV